MPCLVGCLAVAAPRFALFLVWLFSNFLGRAYESFVWPFLGFFFMPLTTLAYAAAVNWNGSVSGWYFALVLVAALSDLGFVGGARWSGKRVVVERRSGGPARDDRIYDAKL
jgi:hypothetical protein